MGKARRYILTSLSELGRGPFSPTKLNSLLLSNKANWDNRKKVKRMRSLFFSDIFMDVFVVGS